MAIRRPPTTFSDSITGADLASDIAISTTGNIATTGSGTLTVAGNTTLSGTNNLGSNPTLTLGSNATFPNGHVLNTEYLLMNHDTDFDYSSTGSDLTCTNITLTINKQLGSSYILCFGSMMFNLYNSSVTVSTGIFWFNRTAPTSTSLGYMQPYMADESASRQFDNHYWQMPINFIDTSTSTGNHTYVAHIQRTSSGGSFGVHSQQSGRQGFMFLQEIADV